MALALPIQSDPVQTRRKSNLYLDTHRPWLSLYGVRVRPVPPVGSLSSKPVCDPSLIHRLLPDELLYEVFARMPPYTLGRAAAVCRKWRYGIRSPALWRDACLRTWQMCGVQENERIVQSYYVGSWARMFRERPHLRFDGLYVSRNTYIRAGVAEWKITNPVHLVCYYRYIRFYPSGKFLYKNSSLKLKEVAKLFQGRALKAEAVYCGRYTLTKDQVEAAILYPGVWPTVLRIRIRIRGTVPGANNRLDLLSLVTIGVNDTEAVNREEDGFGTVEGLGDEENHNPDVPAVSHRRGLAPFVFVPFEEVDSSELNLPVDKMDYYVPG